MFFFFFPLKATYSANPSSLEVKGDSAPSHGNSSALLESHSVSKDAGHRPKGLTHGRFAGPRSGIRLTVLPFREQTRSRLPASACRHAQERHAV